MLKSSFWRTFAATLLALVLTACGGGAGGSAAAPGDFTVTPGNGQVIISFSASPGVQYWLMYAPTATPLDIKNPPGNHAWATNITSPYVISGLTNGVTYSFAMNGRTGGGAGGAQTASQSVAPRAAGANWKAGSGTTAIGDLRGLAFGTSSADSLNYYLAVGDNGAMYKGLDGVSQSLNGYGWGVLNGPTVNYKAALNVKLVANATNRYIAVGEDTIGNGTNSIVSSTDLATWTSALWASGTIKPSSSINALASNGTTTVAVGNGGAAYFTTDGLTWTSSDTLPTSANLYGVTYSTFTGMWIAVGASGTLLTSPDAKTWTAGSSGVGNNIALRSVAATIGNVVVAVGDSGTIITNNTMTTAAGGAGAWVAPTVGPTNSNVLYAVTTDSAVNALDPQFLAVGQGGVTYTSVNGLTWNPPVANSAGPTNSLYGIIGTASKYVGVGASGAVFSSIN